MRRSAISERGVEAKVWTIEGSRPDSPIEKILRASSARSIGFSSDSLMNALAAKSVLSCLSASLNETEDALDAVGSGVTEAGGSKAIGDVAGRFDELGSELTEFSEESDEERDDVDVVEGEGSMAFEREATELKSGKYLGVTVG